MTIRANRYPKGGTTKMTERATELPKRHVIDLADSVDGVADHYAGWEVYDAAEVDEYLASIKQSLDDVSYCETHGHPITAEDRDRHFYCQHRKPEPQPSQQANDRVERGLYDRAGRFFGMVEEIRKDSGSEASFALVRIQGPPKQ